MQLLVVLGQFSPPAGNDTPLVEVPIGPYTGSELQMENSQPILKWIKDNKIKHLAIHLDLDVLSPQLFRSLLFAEPKSEPIDASMGEMNFTQIKRIIQDVSKQTDMVGLAFAEYLPWDAINLHNFLKDLPILKNTLNQ